MLVLIFGFGASGGGREVSFVGVGELPKNLLLLSTCRKGGKPTPNDFRPFSNDKQLFRTTSR